MTSEFYLQTIEHVFQKHSLPRGEFVHRGKPIDPDAIRDTAILAIEGERDDISGIGQTRAALDLAEHLPRRRKLLPSPRTSGIRHLNGSKWRKRIAPSPRSGCGRTRAVSSPLAASRRIADYPSAFSGKSRAPVPPAIRATATEQDNATAAAATDTRNHHSTRPSPILYTRDRNVADLFRAVVDHRAPPALPRATAARWRPREQAITWWRGRRCRRSPAHNAPPTGRTSCAPVPRLSQPGSCRRKLA